MHEVSHARIVHVHDAADFIILALFCEVEAEGSALAWRELAEQCGGAAFLSTRFLIFILIDL